MAMSFIGNVIFIIFRLYTGMQKRGIIMKKKNVGMVLSLVLALSLLTGCGGSEQSSKTATKAESKDKTSGAAITLQLAHVNPSKDEDNLQHSCLTFANKLKELSGGTMTVKVIGDSQLGSDREVIEGMQMGTVDMSLSMNSSLGSFNPKLQALDLPYMFENRKQVYAVFGDKEIMGALKKDLYENNNILILDMFDNGFRNCLNNVKPINSINDVKGMKLRLPENAIWSDCFKAFGASPTTMAFSEVYTACQQGTVDGFELPIASTYSGGYWEVCKYYSLTEHLFTALDLCISRITWDKLNKEQQNWVQEAADFAMKENYAYIQKQEDKWLKAIGEKMKVNKCADKSGFIAAAQSTYKKYSDQIGKDMMDKIMKKVASVK